MGEAMKSYLRESGLGPKLRDWPIYEAWREALGTELARRARPVTFRAGVLTVEVESAAHKQELTSFTGEAYRRAANEHLKPAQKITSVVFKLKR